MSQCCISRRMDDDKVLSRDAAAYLLLLLGLAQDIMMTVMEQARLYGCTSSTSRIQKYSTECTIGHHLII